VTDTLHQHLLKALTSLPATSLCVAFSGGPDSSALLHALAQLPEARSRGLRVLHVDHGLHPQSSRWVEHCRDFCTHLALPCKVLRVTVERDSGEGLEAAARRARYQALETELGEGEVLLLAHHRDDQAETVLLKLLRGAGPEGLGGMRALRPLGRGQLWRPLLDLPRQQLTDYIATHKLACIDDPSNSDTRHARNQLRHEILPRLQQHWPHAVESILHSARLSRDAADALRDAWMVAFDNLHDANTNSLDAAGWLALVPALREPLLDHWLHGCGLTAPTTAQRRQIERQGRARAGKLPCIRWPGAELHIWKDRLWALPPESVIDPDWTSTWHGEPLSLPDGGQLSLNENGATLTQPLRVRLRQGGERIKPAGDAHTRELRDLFQQGLLPPWQRIACPLLYVDRELVAVADRWINARGKAIFQHSGATLRWQPGR